MSSTAHLPQLDMKGHYVRHILVSLLFALAAASTAWAQEVSTVELQVKRLRAQLRDVVDREAQLQDRAGRLLDELRSESIERSVAAVGTTDAAALRARRREQIEKQKADVDAQLSDASVKRAKLESKIAAAEAEAEAVRLKAAALAPKETAPRDTPVAAPVTPTPAPTVRRKAPTRKRTPPKRSRPRRRV